MSLLADSLDRLGAADAAGLLRGLSTAELAIAETAFNAAVEAVDGATDEMLRNGEIAAAERVALALAAALGAAMASYLETADARHRRLEEIAEARRRRLS